MLCPAEIRKINRLLSFPGLNKGSDNEDLEEEPEVKNLKYWATKSKTLKQSLCQFPFI